MEFSTSIDDYSGLVTITASDPADSGLGIGSTRMVNTCAIIFNSLDGAAVERKPGNHTPEGILTSGLTITSGRRSLYIFRGCRPGRRDPRGPARHPLIALPPFPSRP